ncbi:DUF2093 domain-containing protein [Hyphobacterium marinum]|uniref:DUF2093 domain-containing protein n=1 Tax=Hyphobacterium marinum TaxID=3116574 RepID=A0ABU7LWV9_9PROT|nr:DUF2093 domain-containing protein [Hyphobacterium sp. Y6023]MEE2565966.1 DUF2093 domain-containing protein [Hyphobacterium sp. Y6023]
MNTPFEDDFSGEAQLEYGDADFMILKPGAYVVCAVTGDKIPLNDLRYWSAVRQEAYRDAYASVQQWRETHKDPAQ